MDWHKCEDSMQAKALSLGQEFPSYRFTVGKVGSRLPYYGTPMWGSVFVTNPDGIQIGRLIFKEGAFDHSKIYGCRMGLKENPIWSLLETAAS